MLKNVYDFADERVALCGLECWTDGEADWESAKMVVGHCAERAAEGAGGSAEAGAVQPLSAVSDGTLPRDNGHCSKPAGRRRAENRKMRTISCSQPKSQLTTPACRGVLTWRGAGLALCRLDSDMW